MGYRPGRKHLVVVFLRCFRAVIDVKTSYARRPTGLNFVKSRDWLARRSPNLHPGTARDVFWPAEILHLLVSDYNYPEALHLRSRITYWAPWQSAPRSRADRDAYHSPSVHLPLNTQTYPNRLGTTPLSFSLPFAHYISSRYTCERRSCHSNSGSESKSNKKQSALIDSNDPHSHATPSPASPQDSRRAGLGGS